MRAGLSCRITPLSSYALSCHTPFHMIALPSFQSETTLVPNMYCLTAAGVTSASQTLVLGALIEIAALAMRFMVSILAPPERRINRQPFDHRTGGRYDLCLRTWAGAPDARRIGCSSAHDRTESTSAPADHVRGRDPRARGRAEERPILSKRRGVVAREIANRSEAGEHSCRSRGLSFVVWRENAKPPTKRPP